MQIDFADQNDIAVYRRATFNGPNKMANEQSGAENWIEYYRRLSEEGKKTFRFRVPEGDSHLILIDGRTILVPTDRIVEVSKEDAVAFGQLGWEGLD